MIQGGDPTGKFFFYINYILFALLIQLIHILKEPEEVEVQFMGKLSQMKYILSSNIWVEYEYKLS